MAGLGEPAGSRRMRCSASRSPGAQDRRLALAASTIAWTSARPARRLSWRPVSTGCPTRRRHPAPSDGRWSSWRRRLRPSATGIRRRRRWRCDACARRTPCRSSCLELLDALDDRTLPLAAGGRRCGWRRGPRPRGSRRSAPLPRLRRSRSELLRSPRPRRRTRVLVPRPDELGGRLHRGPDDADLDAVDRDDLGLL